MKIKMIVSSIMVFEAVFAGSIVFWTNLNLLHLLFLHLLSIQEREI
jgi:hypothetical protein